MLHLPYFSAYPKELDSFNPSQNPNYPLDIGNNIERTSGIQKTSELFMYVQFMPCVQGVNSDVSRLFGRPVYRFGCPNSGAQKTLFKFSFFNYISSKNMLM